MNFSTLSSLLEKFRTWGVRGAFAYVYGKALAFRRDRLFERNAKEFPLTPQPGVTIIGPIGGQESYSKVLRDLIYKLSEAQIPFQTYDLSCTLDGIESDIRPLLTPDSAFRALRYSTIIGGFPRNLLRNYPQVKKYRMLFWEFESGLLENEGGLRNEQGVLAMSSFNAKEFRRALPRSVPVREILYPFRYIDIELIARTTIRSQFELAEDNFVVFYNFSINSSYYRKNPEAAIRAFARAFKDVDEARLVFKVQGSGAHQDKMERMKGLADRLGVGEKLVFVTQYLTTRELYSLTAASDVYLSLHRGEGFGIGIVEAMSLGVPAVVTNYSAPTEFCNAGNSMLVPFVMRHVLPEEVDLPAYRFVKQWAEPDVHAAANALRKLHASKDFRLQMGKVAREFVLGRFSSVNFKKSCEEFLHDQTLC